MVQLHNLSPLNECRLYQHTDLNKFKPHVSAELCMVSVLRSCAAWLQFPVRSASPTKRKTSPPKSTSLSFKQISLKPMQVDESRLKAWKLTGVVSLRDSELQV